MIAPTTSSSGKRCTSCKHRSPKLLALLDREALEYVVDDLLRQIVGDGRDLVGGERFGRRDELLGVADRIYTIFEGAITGCLDASQADQESLMRRMTSAATAAVTA